MKDRILLIGILLFSLVLFSCTKVEKSNLHDNSQSNTSLNDPDFKKDSIPKIINLIFPDTVFVNKNIIGELKYDIQIDTLKPSDLIERFIYLYVSSEKLYGGVKEVEKINHKIFLDTIGDGTFFFNAKFDNLGDTGLTLVLQDNVLVKGKTSEEKLVVLTDETTIIRNVFVKE